MNKSAPAAESPGAARRAERLASRRLQRELATIAAMLRIYCHDHHHSVERGADRLCGDCHELLDYAQKRLAGCPYGPQKPTCTNCRIHCYGPMQREKTRVMMRYAGPRMMWRHPLLAIAHLIDGRRPAPPKPRAAVGASDPARYAEHTAEP